jgi:hypothetical protein
MMLRSNSANTQLEHRLPHRCGRIECLLMQVEVDVLRLQIEEQSE